MGMLRLFHLVRLKKSVDDEALNLFVLMMHGS